MNRNNAGNPNEGDLSSLPLYHGGSIHEKTTMTRIKRSPRRGGRGKSSTLTGGTLLVGLVTFMFVLVLTFQGQYFIRNRSRKLQVAEPDVEGVYDVAIAGAGPAGLTAALFAARAGLNVIVLGSSAGLLSETKHLDNFPSFVNTAGGGPSWLKATKQQATDFGAHFAPPGLLAASLQKHDGDDGSYFEFPTSLETYKAWAVVIASGAKPRQLGLPAEENLWGSSLHSCAICDGHLYRDQVVLVVGGGDAAIDAAILLSRHASKVVVVHRRNEFSGKNQVTQQVAQSTPNIEFKMQFVVKEWKTARNDPSALIGAKIHNVESQVEETIDVVGAFVMIGSTPNTEWLKDSSSAGMVQLDKEGLIELMPVGKNNNNAVTQSTTPGIFACGEVTDNIYKQAITASAAGAQAAIDAERWLRETRGVRPHRRNISSRKNAKDTNRKIITNARVHQEQAEDFDRQKPDILVPDALADLIGRQEPLEKDDCDLTKQDCISSIVHKHPVVVFSKPWCPYCRKALEALSLTGINNPHVIDLSTHPNAQTIQLTLQKMTGRRTVPNVFVGGSSIGGGDETSGLQRSGRLVPLLQERGALPVAHKQEEELRPDANQEEAQTRSVAVDEKNGKESCDLLEASCFEAILKEYRAVMFSLSWCPECHRELELLERIGVKDKVHIIDLDDYKPISQHIRNHMLQKTGRRQVPNLFVGGEYVGGFVRTSEIHERGELVSKFEKVGLL